MACKHFREDVIPSKVTTDKTTPLVGESSVHSIFIVVVFPAPFGPKKPNISPSLTLKLTSFTAVKFLNLLVSFLTDIIVFNLSLSISTYNYFNIYNYFSLPSSSFQQGSLYPNALHFSGCSIGYLPK